MMKLHLASRPFQSDILLETRKYSWKWNRSPNLSTSSVSSFKKPTTTPTLAPSTSKLPIKKLTPADQLQARRDKGYSKQFFLLESADNEDEESVVVDQTQPIPSQIFYNALAWHSNPETIRVRGFIQGHEVQVLVDGGSTHNFIQERIAAYLKLPAQRVPSFTVTVGNGDQLQGLEICKEVQLILNGHEFGVDLYVLPLKGAELVLGVQWLEQLGPILFNYKFLTMQFYWNDSTVVLQGGRRSYGIPQQIQLHTLKRLRDTSAVEECYSLQLQLQADHDFVKLLQRFAALFETPTVLPP